MSFRVPIFRAVRFRLRSLLIVIAFLGLSLTVVVLTVRTTSREARLQAELRLERARAESNRDKARAAVGELYTLLAKQQALQAAVPGEARRELLEPMLKHYQKLEAEAATPESKANARARVRQIRSILGDEGDETRS
jgi:hypothetical protein